MSGVGREKIVSRAFGITQSERSKRVEKKVAKKYGGKRQPGSGCFQLRRGDIVLDDFLVEDKRTGKKSYSISLDLLEKIEREALAIRKSPMVLLHFESAKVGNYSEWIIIPLSVAEKRKE